MFELPDCPKEEEIQTDTGIIKKYCSGKLVPLSRISTDTEYDYQTGRTIYKLTVNPLAVWKCTKCGWEIF